jgi:hypothetical protein
VLSRKNTIISLALAQNIAVVFLILLATRIKVHPVPIKARTEQMLFIAPLVSMALWVNSATYGWQKSTQIVFILLMLQFSIAFVDLGGVANNTWVWVAAAMFLVLAFLFLFTWADELNARG